MHLFSRNPQSHGIIEAEEFSPAIKLFAILIMYGTPLFVWGIIGFIVWVNT